jgi:hypothetical protein
MQYLCISIVIQHELESCAWRRTTGGLNRSIRTCRDSRDRPLGSICRDGLEMTRLVPDKAREIFSIASTMRGQAGRETLQRAPNLYATVRSNHTC